MAKQRRRVTITLRVLVESVDKENDKVVGKRLVDRILSHGVRLPEAFILGCAVATPAPGRKEVDE